MIAASASRWLAAACALALLLAAQWATAAPVRIAATRTAVLMWLAQDKGFFGARGVDVDLVLEDGGNLAAAALMANEVDLATSSEFAWVNRAIRDPDMRIIASISQSDTVDLVMRRDHGVETVQDLVGKRVGVTPGTASAFFFHRLMALEGVDVGAIDIVPLGPPEIVEQVVSGEVDAGVTWEPFAFNAAQSLGDLAVTMPAQSGDAYYFVLHGKGAWLTQHSDEATRILEALKDAEDFVQRNTAAAQAFVIEKLGYATESIGYLWPRQLFQVSLPQELIWIMEEEAEWYRDHVDGEAVPMPNFIKQIDFRPMENASASSITIYR